MAKFLNEKIEDVSLNGNKGGDAAPVLDAGLLKQQHKTVKWEDAVSSEEAREASLNNQAQYTTPEVTVTDSFAAGMGNSVVAAALRKVSAPDFDADANYNSFDTMNIDDSLKVFGFNKEELDYVGKSKSLEEYDYRKSQVMKQRERDLTAGSNLVAGLVGSLVGDAPFMFMPMSGATGLAGKVGLAVRTGIRAGEAATTYYAKDQLGQSPEMLALIGSVIGLDQLWDMKSTAKAIRGAKKISDLEPKVMDDVPPTEVAPLLPEPKGDVKPTPTPKPKKAKEPTKEKPVVDTTPTNVDPDSPALTREYTIADLTGADEFEKAMYTTLDEPMVVSKKSNQDIRMSKGTFINAVKWRIKDAVKEGAITAKRAVFLNKIVDTLKDSMYVSDIRLSSGTGFNSKVRTSNVLEHSELILRSHHANGTVIEDLKDVVKGIEPTEAVHEIIHAATSRIRYGIKEWGESAPESIREASRRLDTVFRMAKSKLKGTGKVNDYAFHSAHEFMAQIANDPKLIDELEKIPSPFKKSMSLLSDFAETLLEILGLSTKKNMANDVLEIIDILKKGNKARLEEASKVKSVSNSFKSVTDNAPVPKNEKAAADTMLNTVKDKVKQSFALFDNIASGDEDLAKLLVSDATNTAAREPSVVDIKRNLELEMNLRASRVEDALVRKLKQQDGITAFDMFFNRAKFRDARARTEEKLTHYLQKAFNADISGVDIPTVPDEIADIVKEYVDSGWAKTWREHAINNGLAKADELPESAFYIPRQYSHARLSKFAKDDVLDLMKKSLKSTYEDMDPLLAARVANSWYKRILRTGQRAKGSEWRELVHGMDEGSLFNAMLDAGIDKEAANKFINVNVPKTGATSKVKNLNRRAQFDMFAPVALDSGNIMSLSDLMQTNTMSIMQGYTNRMSGRAAFAAKGITDMKNLTDMIDDIATNKKPPTEWFKTVDDTINHLLGMNVGGEIPEWMRGASNIANSVMLKNSGLYQLTDMAIAMKEFGMSRVLKAMVKAELFKGMDNVIVNDNLRGRLYNVLNGAYQHEARFRFLTTHADDNLDLTNTSSFYMATHNISQSARLANGFSMVHRMMVNMTSSMVADAFDNVIKSSDIIVKEGGITARGSDAIDSLKVLREAGMSDDLLRRLRDANKANPDGVFDYKLQQELEIVGTRVMDYMIQNIRTGETSAFAQFSAIGKVVVGYQSFALAATNKLLRRHTANDDYTGLAMLAAYQLPLMLLATKAKTELDGKDLSPEELVSQSVMNMSLIGGLSLLSPIFTGEPPRHSLTSTAYITQAAAATRDIMSGNTDLQTISRVFPLAQEIIPLRALINNLDAE